jgi:hypothetical protein
MFRRAGDASYDYDAPVWEGRETTFEDTGLGIVGENTLYSWVVRAFLCTETGMVPLPCPILSRSENSNEVSTEIDWTLPSPVSDLAGYYDRAADQVQLNWNDPQKADILYWKVFYSQSAEGPWADFEKVDNSGQTDLTATNSLEGPLNAVTPYYFSVVSYKRNQVYSTHSNIIQVLVDKRIASNPINLRINVVISD